MWTLSRGMIACGLLTACISGVYAQSASSEKPLPQHPFRLKLGFTGATGFSGGYSAGPANTGTLKPDTILTRFAAGVSYDLQKTSPNRSTIANVFLDYMSGFSNETLLLVPIIGLFPGTSADANVDTTGIGFGIRYIPGRSRQHYFYGEAGLGLYLTHLKIDEVTYKFNGPTVTVPRYNTTQVKPGGKLIIGYQFSPRFFSEAEYVLVDKVKRDGLTYSPSSSRFSLGFAF